MPKSPDDVINTPIKASDYSSDPLGSEDILSDEMELDNEIDPIGDDALDEISDDEDTGMNDSEFNKELNSEDTNLPEIGEPELEQKEPEMVAPEEQIKWTETPQDNGDIVSRHVNGFVLMARPLSAKNGDKIKYASRLSKDGKVIESGIIWIDKNEDARQYLQNIADRILDRTNLINLSKEKAKPSPETAKNEKSESGDLGGGGLDLGGGGGLDLGGGDEFDLGGGDQDVDLGGEEDNAGDEGEETEEPEL